MQQMQQGRRYHNEWMEQKQQNEFIERKNVTLCSELMEERALRQRQQEKAAIDVSNLMEQKQQNESIEREKAALHSELMEERALRQRQQEKAAIDFSNLMEQKQQNESIQREKAALRSKLMEERALRQRQQEEAEIDSSNLTMSSNPDLEQVVRAKIRIEQELADSEAKLEETREMRRNSLAAKKTAAAAYEQANQNQLMCISNQALEQDSKWSQWLACNIVKPQLDCNGSTCTSSVGLLPTTMSTSTSSSGLPVAQTTGI